MFGSDNDEAIVRGEAARLSGIRTALSSSSSALLNAALEPFLRRDDNEDNTNVGQEESAALLLYQEHDIFLSWQFEDDEDDGEQEASSCLGYLAITQEAVLFCSIDKSSSNNNNNTSSTEKDWYVPATSITLHALTGDDDDENEQQTSSGRNGVYLQMQNPHDEECNPIEWTVTSRDAPALYAALSKLVSLHPIDPHKDTNGLEDGDDQDDYFEPEDMIWASDIRNNDSDDEEEEGATEEERQAMLDRLDRVLTVPPEYEIHEDAAVEETTEGQFDDAEEEDDDIL